MYSSNSIPESYCGAPMTRCRALRVCADDIIKSKDSGHPVPRSPYHLSLIFNAAPCLHIVFPINPVITRRMHCLGYPVLCTYSMIESFYVGNGPVLTRARPDPAGPRIPNFPLCSLSEERNVRFHGQRPIRQPKESARRCNPNHDNHRYGSTRSGNIEVSSLHLSLSIT